MIWDIRGGESGFIKKNRYLLFSIPAIITSHPNFLSSGIKKNFSYPPVETGSLFFYYQEYVDRIIETVRQHNKSFFVLWQLLQNRDYLSIEALEKCSSIFDESLMNTSKGKELKTYIESAKHLFVGAIIPNVNVKDENGGVYSLSSIYSRQDFTFLDFWASWCIPCRQSMKSLKSHYDSLRRPRVKFVSVSIDKDHQNWLTAAKEEASPWDSYIDAQEKEGLIEKKFNLSYIPQNILVGKNGVIIDVNMSKEDLLNFCRKVK